MRAWLDAHARGMQSAISRLVRAPFSTLANLIVIGAAVSLPLVGMVAVRSLDSVAGEVTGRPVLNVFMTLDAGRTDVARIEGLAKNRPGITSVKHISKEAALERLKGIEGLGEAIATLRTNPLPDAFEIELAAGNAADGDKIAAMLRAADKVASVQWEGEIHRRVDAVLSVGRILLAAFGVLLGIALVAITFNTVRLQILAAVEEIAVSRLVGATDAYIRRPFCYYGLALGFVGGTAGAILAVIVVTYIANQIARLAGEFGSTFQLNGLLVADLLGAILFAGVLGLLGAYLSVSRHLRTSLRQA
jgi:cell division transport system permease protein